LGKAHAAIVRENPLPNKPSTQLRMSRKRRGLTHYANASICGNKYRLVVEMQYRAGIVWIKFVGTHAQYDLIDVESVNDH
jgi:hypothetical protein